MSWSQIVVLLQLEEFREREFHTYTHANQLRVAIRNLSGSRTKKTQRDKKKTERDKVSNRPLGQKKRKRDKKKTDIRDKIKNDKKKRHRHKIKNRTRDKIRNGTRDKKRHQCVFVCVGVWVVCGLVGVLVCVGVFWCVLVCLCVCFGCADRPSAGPPSYRTAFRRTALRPPPDRPKFRFFFSPLPALIFVLFLSVSGSFLVEFCWCLKRQDPLMCTFGVLGLSCETPAAPKPPAKKARNFGPHPSGPRPSGPHTLRPRTHMPTLRPPRVSDFGQKPPFGAPSFGPSPFNPLPFSPHVF